MGVAAHGVVAGQPFEALTAAGDLVGPGALVHEDLAFEGGIEGFGQLVVRAGADGLGVKWWKQRVLFGRLLVG